MGKGDIESGGGLYKGDLFGDPETNGVFGYNGVVEVKQRLMAVDRHLADMFSPEVMAGYDYATQVRYAIENETYLCDPEMLNVVRLSGVDVKAIQEFSLTEEDDPIKHGQIDERALREFPLLDRAVEEVCGLQTGVLDEVGDEWCRYVSIYGI